MDHIVREMLNNIERLRDQVDGVRQGSPTARDDMATVLHLLGGGDGNDDGYGLLKSGFDVLDLDPPRTKLWGSTIDTERDGAPVVLGLRTYPHPSAGQVGSLDEHLCEECLRFAVKGFEPEANWSYLDVIKKVRNKFGSHVDRNPPRWLRELRYYPAADSDALTLLLSSAAETVLTSTTTSLIHAGLNVELHDPANHYLDGIDLGEAYMWGSHGATVNGVARVNAEQWAVGYPRPLIGALFGDRAAIFGLTEDGELKFFYGQPGTSVHDAADEFKAQPPPSKLPGRNEPCWCGRGRKFKHCHGR
jgi:hypothetical protein